MWPSSSWPGSPGTEGCCSSAARREGAGVAHRAPLQRRGQALRLVGAVDGVRQLLLFLLRGRGFGPFFIKFCTYFPYTAKLCLNGNEWAKHQAAKAGSGSRRWKRVRRSRRRGPAADDLRQPGTHQIDALLRKWLQILPNPFTGKDEAAGYRYELSVLQAEFSLTQMLDRPVSGRIFFEQVLHDNLDIGRPDHVSLIFDRRIIAKGRARTPGRSAPG